MMTLCYIADTTLKSFFSLILPQREHCQCSPVFSTSATNFHAEHTLFLNIYCIMAIVSYCQ